MQFLSSYSVYSVSERQSLSEMATKAFENLRKGTTQIENNLVCLFPLKNYF